MTSRRPTKPSKRPQTTRSRLCLERLEQRLAFSAILEPLAVVGTANDDTIQIEAANGSRTEVFVTLNGTKSGPYQPSGPITIRGQEGNDSITVQANVYLPTVIEGGPGKDNLVGGSGDDLFQSDGESDTVDGGLGLDRAATDSPDFVSGVETLNPMSPAADNITLHKKILVLNFEPEIPSEGNKKPWELIGGIDPRVSSQLYETYMEQASGGAVDFDVVEWRDLNEIPAFTDGYRYTPDEWLNNSWTNTGWHEGQINFPRIVAEQNIVPLVDSGRVDEVWFFGDHYFVAVIGETWTAGPGSFYINGPVYSQIPSQRSFACIGFGYGAMNLHGLGHRTEATMNRIYGNWNLEQPTNNWERFSANYEDSNGLAGVGTTHLPANGASHYDTFNPRVVQSWADDFLNYPNLTGATTPLNRDSWGRGPEFFYERDYQNWYFAHLPRAAGVNPDGKENNWWKYVFDFNNYTESGQPKPLSASAKASDVYNVGDASQTFSVAYSGAAPVDISTIGDGDIVVTGPNGFSGTATLVGLSDEANDTHVVATYRIVAPGGAWDSADRGVYSIRMQSGEVRDVIGATLPESTMGAFNVRGAAGSTLANDSDTSLLLHFDERLVGAAGESPASRIGTSFSTGKVSGAVRLGISGGVYYPQAGNIAAGEGTVEFWIKPNWNADGTTHNFFQVGDRFNNGMIMSIDGANNLRFLQWGDDPATEPKETAVEHGVGFGASNWTAGTWHHLAATWSQATHEMSLYVDGQPVGSAIAVNIPAFTRSDLLIGSAYGGYEPSNASFDEFRISLRARSAGEIRADYLSGVSLVNLSISAQQSTLTVGVPQLYRAVATADDGQQFDVSDLVRWSSSNPNVITVGSDGAATLVASGNAEISAILDGLTANSSVTVQPPSEPFVASVEFGGTAPRFGRLIQQISIDFSSQNTLDESSLGLGDIRLCGPNGFSTFPRLVSLDGNAEGSNVATYEFTPPGGYWDPSDNGRYALEVKGFQVKDVEGNYVPGNAAPGVYQVAVNLFSPWQNDRNRFDVDDDGHVAPGDVLTIINYLNAYGPTPVPDNAEAVAPFCDVDGDGHISPGDALEVINYLNGQPGISAEGEDLELAARRDFSASEMAHTADPLLMDAALDAFEGDFLPGARSRRSSLFGL